MSNKLVRQSIVTEIERAKTNWNTANPTTPIVVDYENKAALDLSQITLYLSVDIVFHDSQQLDMGLLPNLCDDGQITVAAGVKEGTGTQQAETLRDFIRPYLQLRDNLGNGVRTHQGAPYPPKTANGFYYLPLVVGFWRVATAPAVP